MKKLDSETLYGFYLSIKSNYNFGLKSLYDASHELISNTCYIAFGISIHELIKMGEADFLVKYANHNKTIEQVKKQLKRPSDFSLVEIHAACVKEVDNGQSEELPTLHKVGYNLQVQGKSLRTRLQKIFSSLEINYSFPIFVSLSSEKILKLERSFDALNLSYPPNFEKEYAIFKQLIRAKREVQRTELAKLNNQQLEKFIDFICKNYLSADDLKRNSPSNYLYLHRVANEILQKTKPSSSIGGSGFIAKPEDSQTGNLEPAEVKFTPQLGKRSRWTFSTGQNTELKVAPPSNFSNTPPLTQSIIGNSFFSTPNINVDDHEVFLGLIESIFDPNNDDEFLQLEETNPKFMKL